MRKSLCGNDLANGRGCDGLGSIAKAPDVPLGRRRLLCAMRFLFLWRPGRRFYAFFVFCFLRGARALRFVCAACETRVRFDALACAPCTHGYVCNAHFTWVRAGECATCAGHVRGRAEIAQRFACAACAVLREDAPHPLMVRAAARFTTGARAAGGLFRLCPRYSAAPVRDALRKCRSRW